MSTIIDEQTKYDLSKPVVKPNVFQPKVRTDYRSQQMGTNVPVSTTQPTTNTTTSSELQGVTLPSNEELNKVKANTTDANVNKMAVQNERGQVEAENKTQQNTQFAPNTQYANGLAEGDVNKTQVANDKGNAVADQAQSAVSESSTPQGTQTTPVNYNTAPVQDGGNSYTPEQKTPQTWDEMRDYLYGSEAEREKEANRKAKIQAVGDALRHIGNLATTIGSDKMGRAIPQQFKTSPAQQTLDTYKAEKEQRDAKALTYWQMAEKQKQQQRANELALAELAEKQRVNDANIRNKEAGTKKILQDMGIQEAKYPYELNKLIADAAQSGAEADMKAIEAQLKKVYGPKKAEAELNEIASRIRQHNASAAASYASAENSRANAAKTRAEIPGVAGSGVTTLPMWNNGKYNYDKAWNINGKEDAVKKRVVSKLANYAREQNWVKTSGGGINYANYDPNNMSEGQLSNMYEAIISHASDPVAQKVFQQIQTEFNGGSAPQPASGGKGGNTWGSFSIH